MTDRMVLSASGRIATLVLLATFACQARAAAPPPKVVVASYAGPITPVVAEYFLGAIAEAERRRAQAVVLELDTPGGLDLAMRDIVKGELSSKIPVIVFISPPGARAASAGVFIAMAAHVAAMAPGTNIGAAHPIQLGMPSSGPKDGEKGRQDDAMEAKTVNDAAAYLQAIARRRGRNADWAALVVAKSTSVPSSEAVRQKVVDLEAESLSELLDRVHGRSVEGLAAPLRTRGAQVERLEMTRRQKALAAVSDPNVAMILLSIGLAGIMIELYSPGLILPGIVGVVSLVTAFYSLQTLSANFAGLLLIALGLLLFLLELKIASFGLLALSGVASILFGGLMLFRDAQGGLMVSPMTIVSSVGVLLAVLAALLFVVRRALGARPRAGREALKGQRATCTTALNPLGTVLLGSELWRAESLEGELGAGAEVVVAESSGLTLKVRRAKRP